MHKVNMSGADATHDYKIFGEQILEQSRAILAKNGINAPLFKPKEETNQDVYAGAKPDCASRDDKKSKEDIQKGQSELDEAIVSKNKMIKNIKNSTSFINTVYNASVSARADILRANSDRNEDYDESDNETNEQQTGDFVGELGTIDDSGSENEQIEQFFNESAPKGFHTQTSVYSYVEDSKQSTEYSTSATVFNTYCSNNERFTSVLGGTIEYSKVNTKADSNDRQKACQLSAYTYNKYDAKKYTVAGTFSTNQTKGNQNYAIGLGAMHNATGITVTAVRNIDAVYDSDGRKHFDSRTNVKINLMENDPTKRKTIVSPYNPTDKHETVVPDGSADEAKKVISEEETVSQNIEKYAEDNGYGWGVDLELNTSHMTEEYGGTVYYSKLVNDIKDDNHYKLVITPNVSLYDVHPNSDEAFKAGAGLIVDYSLRQNNGLEVDMSANVKGSRVMKGGNSPTNMFLTSFNGRLKKGKWSAELKAGHVINNANLRFSYLSTFIERSTKILKLYLEGAYGTYNINGKQDNVSHLGLGCILNI